MNKRSDNNGAEEKVRGDIENITKINGKITAYKTSDTLITV